MKFFRIAQHKLAQWGLDGHSVFPTERLGAWRAPKPFPYVGTALMVVALSLVFMDLPEAYPLYQLHDRMEREIAAQSYNVELRAAQKTPSKPKMADSQNVSQADTRYQNAESIQAWNAIGAQFNYDPAALFIVLENGLYPEIGLLSLDLNEDKKQLLIQAEAKSIEAIDAWRQSIARQPLLETSRMVKEKWMPEQFGVKPVQLTLEVPVNWNERLQALASLPDKKSEKPKDKESSRLETGQTDSKAASLMSHKRLKP